MEQRHNRRNPSQTINSISLTKVGSTSPMPRPYTANYQTQTKSSQALRSLSTTPFSMSPSPSPVAPSIFQLSNQKNNTMTGPQTNVKPFIIPSNMASSYETLNPSVQTKTNNLNNKQNYNTSIPNNNENLLFQGFPNFISQPKNRRCNSLNLIESSEQSLHQSTFQQHPYSQQQQQLQQSQLKQQQQPRFVAINQQHISQKSQHNNRNQNYFSSQKTFPQTQQRQPHPQEQQIQFNRSISPNQISCCTNCWTTTHQIKLIESENVNLKQRARLLEELLNAANVKFDEIKRNLICERDKQRQSFSVQLTQLQSQLRSSQQANMNLISELNRLHSQFNSIQNRANHPHYCLSNLNNTSMSQSQHQFRVISSSQKKDNYLADSKNITSIIKQNKQSQQQEEIELNEKPIVAGSVTVVQVVNAPGLFESISLGDQQIKVNKDSQKQLGVNEENAHESSQLNSSRTSDTSKYKYRHSPNAQRYSHSSKQQSILAGNSTLNAVAAAASAVTSVNTATKIVLHSKFDPSVQDFGDNDTSREMVSGAASLIELPVAVSNFSAEIAGLRDALREQKRQRLQLEDDVKEIINSQRRNVKVN